METKKEINSNHRLICLLCKKHFKNYCPTYFCSNNKKINYNFCHTSLKRTSYLCFHYIFAHARPLICMYNEQFAYMYVYRYKPNSDAYFFIFNFNYVTAAYHLLYLIMRLNIHRNIWTVYIINQ